MARDLVTISLAVTIGVALGSVRIRGIRLGVSGVLFAALLLGQLGAEVDGDVLRTLRDFALVIFVYAVGLQVGPGFFSSLRADGLRLNAMMALMPLLGGLLSVAVVVATGLPAAFAPGLYAGAFSSTPGLGAAQDSLRNVLGGSPDHGAAAVAAAGVAYTIAYPVGLLGPALVIWLLKRVFRIRMAAELSRLTAAERAEQPPVEWLDFEVTRAAQADQPIVNPSLLQDEGIRFTRVLRDGRVSPPGAAFEPRVGDVIRAVGPATALTRLVNAIGKRAEVDIDHAVGEVTARDLVVTRAQVLRVPLGDLDLNRRFGVNPAWVNRSGVYLMPTPALRLQFGDQIRMVGDLAGLKAAEGELGNSKESLNRTNLIPLFLGIALGAIVGSIPIAIPGFGTSVRLGLAGGALLAAMALSQLGNIGSIVWYMPAAANQLFRDFGMAVFLACLGLKLGDHFLQHLSQIGPSFIAWSLLVAMLPPLLVGLLARLVFRINFVTLSGLVAGGMCCAPALVFANDLAGSDKPAVAYSTVSPLASLTSIVMSQALVMLVR